MLFHETESGHKDRLGIKMLALVFAWLIALVSFITDYQNNTGWFSRSGSILVLIAIIASYQLTAIRNDYHNSQLAAYKDGNNIDFLQSHPSDTHRNLEVFANITAILGTLIWGYGDLIFTGK